MSQVLDASPAQSDEAVGEQLLRDVIFVHLTSRHDKLNLLVLMLRKLYALVRCFASWRAGKRRGKGSASEKASEGIIVALATTLLRNTA